MKHNTIYNFRLKHGLSQQALSELLGVTRVTISNWERGKARMSKIAKILFLTLQQKFSNKEEVHNENK